MCICLRVSFVYMHICISYICGWVSWLCVCGVHSYRYSSVYMCTGICFVVSTNVPIMHAISMHCLQFPNLSDRACYDLV